MCTSCRRDKTRRALSERCMKNPRSLLVAVFLAVYCSGCGGDSARNGSSSTGGSPTSPTAPVAAPAFADLAILGLPASLEVGRSAQLRAVARYSGGGFLDVTDDVT